MGTYCGYSSLRMARLLNDNAKIVTLDIDSKIIEIAQKIIDYAGQTHKIRIINGSLGQNIDILKNEYQNFDLVFIDHSKSEYLEDLILLENNNLIISGSVIVADNVLYPGAPDYLAYIKSKSEMYDNTGYDTMLEYTNDIKDQVWVSIVKSKNNFINSKNNFINNIKKVLKIKN